MPERPSSSPWGKIQRCKTKHPGVFEVSTAGHGGIMVSEKAAAELLSPAAINCGFKERGYVCFEEDCQAAVVIKEMLDKNLWKIPEHFKDGKEKYAEIINGSVMRWNPEYWEATGNALSPDALMDDVTDKENEPGREPAKKQSILADMEQKQKEMKPPTPGAAAKKDRTGIGG